jgi:6-phosphogluconolactonase (cycloisomerase 2 family)
VPAIDIDGGDQVQYRLRHGELDGLRRSTHMFNIKKRFYIVAIAAAALLATATVAFAVVGSVTQTSCVANSGGITGCAAPAHDSMTSARGVATSPDGQDVYVASQGGDSLTHFQRAADGTLTQAECFADAGVNGCTDPANDSLDGARFVTVSPDGTSVYVASMWASSVTHFTRATDGSLTESGCIANAGANGCTDPASDSLSRTGGLVVSPDGTSLYVAGEIAKSVTHFTRAPDGSLTEADCVANLGAFSCTDPANDSLAGAFSVAISADGNSVYVASGGGGDTFTPAHSVTDFDRAADGTLTQAGCIANAGTNGCTNPTNDSLGIANFVAVSPDDASVYVTGGQGDSINVFNRAADGSLSEASCIANGGANGCTDPVNDSIDFPRAVAVSPDGKSVYVASYNNGALTSYVRNADGSLSENGCIDNTGLNGCTAGTFTSLAESFGVTVSPDGKSVYVASQNPGAINHFTREGAPAVVPPVAPPAKDTAAPDTGLSKKPKKKSTKHRVGFTITSTETPSTFECKIRTKNLHPCGSKVTVGLKPGKYTLTARATDAAGNTDATPVKYSFTVRK